MSKFKMLQTVRVVGLGSQKPWPNAALHLPKIGDMGAITGIYSQPLESYTVELVSPDGRSRSLVDFSPEDLEAA
jgi:hypothetical protein